MSLNVKNIQPRLFRVVHDSTKSSYTFLQRHPLFSSAALVCFILYAFLSYIYSFLVYMSPFLVCGIIFIRIFWSSEKTQLRYVKRNEENGEQKKVESKYSKIPKSGRPEMLYKYPSQNATSRRRNFSDKNWDVYGGLEEKAKDLSAVFHNEFTKRNTQKKEGKSFEKGMSSFNDRLSTKKTQVPQRQPLRSEPSMVDLVECGDLDIETKIEDGDDEEGEEAQDDRNKAIEWTEDDQNNLMYLGISEIERNKRLESLIARRKANKPFNRQVEKDVNDKKPMVPVLTKRNNPLDSSKDFEDDLEIPGSAPSLVPKGSYDIPFDLSEEKPNLTGDGFPQEFCSQKDLPFCRHESFSSGKLFPSKTKQDHGSREHYSINSGRKYSDRPSSSRFRRHNTDKGTHDWLIDQLIYNEGIPNPLEKGKETDGKCKTNVANMENDEELENDHETKSMSNQVSESNSIPNTSNIEIPTVSETSGPEPSFPKPNSRLLNLPLSTPTTITTATNISEVMFDTVTSVVDKRQESMFLAHGRLCHTPTYSIASDLQVEVSEVGSLTSTNGENVETNSSIDRDSILYDGDIDKDISSGSEELWGASLHGGKEAQGDKGEGENVEENKNSNDVASPFAQRHINEENAADISSLSSKSNVPEDTPTYHAINSNHNMFGYMSYPIGETEVPQSANSSHALDQLPNEAHSERLEEWCNNLQDNVTNEAQVINDVNNSIGVEHDNMENSRSNEDSSTSVTTRQESIDETSNYSVSSSPRSVLPEKTMADDISLSGFDQHNNELSPRDIMMPQTIQPFMHDTTHESHNFDFNNSQEHTNPQEMEHTNPQENYMEESNVFDNTNDDEIRNKEEQDKSKDDENSENNSYHLNRQEATQESTGSTSHITTLDDMDEKSRDLFDDKVPSTELTKDDKNDKPSSSSIVHEELPKQIIKPIVWNKEEPSRMFDVFD